jgi:hypothetical protein
MQKPETAVYIDDCPKCRYYECTDDMFRSEVQYVKCNHPTAPEPSMSEGLLQQLYVCPKDHEDRWLIDECDGDYD